MKQTASAAALGPASPLRQDLGVFLLMLAVAIVVYAPVAFMQSPLQWDMVDCYLPWRYAAAEGFAHRSFPLWDPYQSFGYPIYGDLRSVFYPDALLAGLFAGGYSIYLLHALFIGYLALAGTGLYLLAGHFTRRRDVRVLLGLAYLLSGFFTGHAQEMFTFTAATWIPWVLYHALHVLRGDGRGSHPPKLALVLFLQLLGGYQAMSIVLLYLLVALGITVVVQRLRAGDGAGVRSMLARLALWSVPVAASLAVLWVSFLDISPHISRFSGVTVGMSQVSPFPPKALLSLLLPYAVIAEIHTFGTDLSATNLYVGLLPLMAFLVGLLRRRTALEYVVLGFGLLCLLASFGAYTPVQPWLYQHVPLMNLFRMPALFRYFMVLALLLLAAPELERWLAEPGLAKRRILGAVAVLVAALVIAVFWAVPLSEADGASIAAHVLEQAPVQIGFLVLLSVAVLLTRQRTRWMRIAFFAFVLLEMGTAVRMNLPTTVASGEVSVSRIHEVVRSGPKGSLVPDLRRIVALNRDDDPALWPLWRNTGDFTKRVSAVGFNSFQINSSWRFETENTDLFEDARQKPVAFLSYRLCPESRWHADDREADELVVADRILAEWHANIGPSSPADRVTLERFDPGSVQATVHTEAGAVLTLAQMDHPGWTVLVDGHVVPHAAGHLALLSVPVPPGSHTVEFRFAKPWVMRAFWFSYLMVALFIGLIVFHRAKGRPGVSSRSAAGRAVATVLLLGLTIGVAWALRPSYEGQRQQDLKTIRAAVADALAEGTGHHFLDVDLPNDMEDLLAAMPGERAYFRSLWGMDLALIDQRLQELEQAGATSVLVASRGGAFPPTTEEVFRYRFPQRRVLAEKRNVQAFLFSKGEARPLLFGTGRTWGQAVDHWPLDAFERNRDTTAFRDGAWFLHPDYPGTPGFEASAGELGATGTVRLIFSLDAERRAPDAVATLWLLVRRPDGKEWSQSLRLDGDYLAPGQEQRVFLVNEPPVPLGEDDRIIAYVWNERTGPVLINHMRLEALAR